MVLTTLFPRWRPGQVTVLAVPTSTPGPARSRAPTHTRAAPCGRHIKPHATLDGGTGQAQVAGSAPWV